MPVATAMERVGSTAPLVAARREFRLLDAMVLVAATAVGLSTAIDRETQGTLRDFFDFVLDVIRSEGWRGVGNLLLELLSEPVFIGKLLVDLDFLASPLVLVWTLILIPLTLVGPRSNPSAIRPGLAAAIASIAAVASILVIPVVVSTTLGVEWNVTWEDLVTEVMVGGLTMNGGLAVLASWATLLVCRRWCAEPIWTDRLGRILGAYWIVAGLATWTGGCLYESQLCRWRVRGRNPWSVFAVGEEIQSFLVFVMPTLVLSTLILTTVQLLRTRLSRRSIDRPGIVAGLAAGLAIFCFAVPYVVGLVAYDGGWEVITSLLSDEPLLYFDEEMATALARFGGLAVVASWTTLLVCRRWPIEPTRIDRVGQILGVFWIVAALAGSMSGAFMSAP